MKHFGSPTKLGDAGGGLGNGQSRRITRQRVVPLRVVEAGQRPRRPQRVVARHREPWQPRPSATRSRSSSRCRRHTKRRAPDPDKPGRTRWRSDRSGRTSARYSPSPSSLKFVCSCPAASARFLPEANTTNRPPASTLHGRKRPFRQVRRPVRQMPTGQIERLAGRIVDLDPVAPVAVFIGNRSGVRRHELADRRVRREQHAPFQRLQHAAAVLCGPTRR